MLESGVAIGCSQPASLALLSQINKGYVENGTDEAARTLRRWISDWRAVRRPGFERLKALCKKVGSDWVAQVTLSPSQGIEG